MQAKAENVLFKSNSDEWETPQSIFDRLNSEFHFTLDPCATKQNHKCASYYTKEQNGLLQNWGGRQCSAIPRTQRSLTGSRRHTEKAGRIIPLSCF
jgi:site-specific DNA-methyltransferase (adenine-specific)